MGVINVIERADKERFQLTFTNLAFASKVKWEGKDAKGSIAYFYCY